MPRSLHVLIQYLQQRLPRGAEAALSDAQLLERFVAVRDESAFTAYEPLAVAPPDAPLVMSVA